MFLIQNILPKSVKKDKKIMPVRIFSDYNAEIHDDRIRIYGNQIDVPFDIIYHVGDSVKFILNKRINTGIIREIKNKTVVIDKDGKSYRISLYDFVSLNNK